MHTNIILLHKDGVRINIVFQCLHGLDPHYLFDHIQHVADSKCRWLRSSPVIVILTVIDPTNTAYSNRSQEAISGTACHMT